METLALVGERSWMADANCAGTDPDLFYPERGHVTRDAKAICKDCVVKSECLEYALRRGEKWGVWGEKSERERRAIRRARVQRGQGLPV